MRSKRRDDLVLLELSDEFPGLGKAEKPTGQMMNDTGLMKKMKLYRHPERIYREIDAAGYEKNAPLKAKDITAFDQYHYLGIEAVEDAIHSLKINSGSNVMEIGSGIGGPARCLAEKTGCHVTALELQSDLHQIASSLTERCGLSGLVRHLCGDILDLSGEGRCFDFVVSWLSFLHIPDRSSLLKKCDAILKPRGKMFIEDFFKRGKFDQEEIRMLSEDVQCSYLPTEEEYKSQLIDNGFTELELIDKTDCWGGFVEERLEKFSKNCSRYVELHGVEAAADIEDFYKKIAKLFRGGNLGGVRIVAGKQDRS